MKYFFQMKEAQDGTPTLIVSLEEGSLMFGTHTKVVNVFIGKEAEDLYNKLLKRAEEAKND